VSNELTNITRSFKGTESVVTYAHVALSDNSLAVNFTPTLL
jgi:hypothetical protein